MAAGVRQTVFSRAIKAAELRWGDGHLQKILSSDCYGLSLKSGSDKLAFDPQGHPLWLGDAFPMACARVDALRSHGYPREALRLAVAVVNAMRLQRRHQLESYKQQKKGECKRGRGWVSGTQCQLLWSEARANVTGIQVVDTDRKTWERESMQIKKSPTYLLDQAQSIYFYQYCSRTVW